MLYISVNVFGNKMTKFFKTDNSVRSSDFVRSSYPKKHFLNCDVLACALVALEKPKLVLCF